jgi:hypothetical protein
MTNLHYLVNAKSRNIFRKQNTIEKDEKMYVN